MNFDDTPVKPVDAIPCTNARTSERFSHVIKDGDVERMKLLSIPSNTTKLSKWSVNASRVWTVEKANYL